MAKPTLMLGNLPVTGSKDMPLRIALLLWGKSGVGKTTFAATAPGQKLWINLDPDGRAAIASRKDVTGVDLEGLSLDETFKQLQNENPLGLDQYLSDHPEVETVVLDSATALTYRALQQSVKHGNGRSSNFVPTMEAPGISAYGGRNAIVLESLTGLLKVTAKHGRHVIITAHEDDPQINDKGITLAITATLGGKITNNITWRLSEIWYMSQVSNVRKIAVRPTRRRSPMKTRMFSDRGSPEYVLDYHAEKPDKGQYTLAAMFAEWEKNGGAKLTVPSNNGSLSQTAEDEEAA